MKNNFLITHIQNTECLACGDSDLRSILDLGKQPLANNYHKGEYQEEYPLNLNLCQNCFHLQLSHTVNPDLMFKNYLYVSGTTKTLREYFDYFASKTLEYLPDSSKVLDIADNDSSSDNTVFGYQERYAEYMYRTNMKLGKLRPAYTAPLDYWHLSEEFGSAPTLSQTFIECDPPIDRVVAVTTEPDFTMDCYFDAVAVRPMQMYSIPGFLTRF